MSRTLIDAGFLQTPLDKVALERKRQIELWGHHQEHTPEYWLGILMEEVGELAKDIIEWDINTEENGWRDEAIQVAAVAASIAGALVNREDIK